MKRLLLSSALALSACSGQDFTTSNAYAIDGDTFDQAGERYRIAAIDAPEFPGHCRVGRRCVSGNPFASQTALQFYLDAGAKCTITGVDVYDRELVVCTIHGEDLGGLLIRLGYAEPYRRS